ncbi:ATP-binding cassette domain-containing protein [Lacticaseibacillus pantheris]|jgi:ABC-2 type transport system ATP-binding protein|uniref:ABC transporter ATPase n=1 Tax=Lacticaseibacillus pantheris DSM 15945 = JCM 12539 = NBRC 106106 TaxID=1423783 RepID=A0A0R1TY34_9LACO|nr:ABC transporter ATP-binding protein [Lacticaseibacillus pantheris]KRL85662.1 ABC transporter ATPase [Lacticaseibacillus pantheris DSM 15945 = JCM 12539 = NBRC 106106]
MSNVLSIRGLTYKRNFKVILRDINCHVESGQIVGLLGANGAGKTTLMRVIAGSAPHFVGSVSVDGAVQPVERKAVVSFSEQIGGTPISTRTAKVVQDWADWYPDFDRSKFDELAQFLDIDMHARLSSLSKGNMKKVVIALSLARRVKLYLLDEPFDGIDSMTRKKIIATIIQWKPYDATLVISDHHVGDIANILDTVMIIKGHDLVTDKPADDIRATGKSIEEYFEDVYAGRNTDGK